MERLQPRAPYSDPFPQVHYHDSPVEWVGGTGPSVDLQISELQRQMKEPSA